ncbi:MAG: CRISPR-associated endonuclease Cas2 [candidate division WOR-3 bacterium]
MLVVLVYDVDARRIPKVLKVGRRYLHWVQNSVFEGYISESQLKDLIRELKKVLDLSYDAIVIYRFEGCKVSRQNLGVQKSSAPYFL